LAAIPIKILIRVDLEEKDPAYISNPPHIRYNYPRGRWQKS